jgi:peptidoglycan endopeptidase LytE
MEYRAVQNRCAVHLPSLNLPISNEDSLIILENKGFKVLEVDIIALARQRIETSTYRRGAKPSEAPVVVDCSSFIKWLYGQRGIWLPRRSIQQRELGIPVLVDEVEEGDVIFVSGLIDYYHTDSNDGVGHVGIATGEGTVIHAADQKARVVESSFEDFVGKTKFRGIRRYVPKDQIILTIETPPDREVEIADDLRWIVLQSLPKR